MEVIIFIPLFFSGSLGATPPYHVGRLPTHRLADTILQAVFLVAAEKRPRVHPCIKVLCDASYPNLQLTFSIWPCFKIFTLAEGGPLIFIVGRAHLYPFTIAFQYVPVWLCLSLSADTHVSLTSVPVSERTGL